MEVRIYITHAQALHAFVKRLEQLGLSFKRHRQNNDAAQKARTTEFFVRMSALVEQVKFACHALNLSFDQLQALTRPELESYLEQSAEALVRNLNERTYQELQVCLNAVGFETFAEGYQRALNHLHAQIEQTFWPIEAFAREAELLSRSVD